MKWKNAIGDLLSEKGCYRLDYLNKNCLEPALKAICNYMNEFNGVIAELEHYHRKEMNEKQVLDKTKVFRLTISYPMDPVIYGKGLDPLNRKFIADLYFEQDKLVLEIRYRRSGGAFLNKYDPEKEVLRSLPVSQSVEYSLEEKMKKWVEDMSARDVYREEANMVNVIEEGFIEERIMELYAEHIKHVSFIKS